MIQENTKLTTVKILKDVYSSFKKVSFDSDVTLQKLVNRTVEFKAETISNIVNEFEMFLKGCGFNFEGRLDLVQEEHEWVQDKRADQEFDYR